MPGLRLTLAQATRLWGLEHDTCRAAVETGERFDERVDDGGQQLGLGVASDDGRQSLCPRHGVIGIAHELPWFELEQARDQGHRALGRRREARLEM